MRIFIVYRVTWDKKGTICEGAIRAFTTEIEAENFIKTYGNESWYYISVPIGMPK